MNQLLSISFTLLITLFPNREIYIESNVKGILENKSSNVQVFEEQLYSSFSKQVSYNDLYFDEKKIGSTIWINRKSGRIKAKFFCVGDVNSNYNVWKKGKKIVAITSIGLEKSNPGLTLESGIIENKNVNIDLEGLCIVYATGGVVVSDITEGNLRIQELGKNLDLNNRGDQRDLLYWAKFEYATIFQSELLVYKDQRFYSQDNKNLKPRILALLRNQTGELFHILINVNAEVKKADFLHGMVNYLRGPGDLEIIAMVDLRKDFPDVLEVYSEREKINEISGEGNMSFSNVNRLLVYYYD